jgi:hypothetical protein
MNVEGPLIAGDQELALQGALQGLGIVYTYNDARIYDWIKQGRLKRVLADWSPGFPGTFYLLFKPPSYAAGLACLYRLPAGAADAEKRRPHSEMIAQDIRDPPLRTSPRTQWPVECRFISSKSSRIASNCVPKPFQSPDFNRSTA